MRNRIGKFEKNSMIVVAFSGITGVLGYIYHLYLGNLMSVTDYGKANSYMSYISLLSIFISPLAIFASKKIAEVERGNEILLDVVLSYVYRIALLVLGSMLLVCLIFAVHKREKAFFYIILTITLASNVLYILLLLMVQGFNDFVLYSVTSLLNVFVKTISSILFIKIGLEMNSVFGGIIAGNVFAIGVIIHSKHRKVFIKRYQLERNGNIRAELQKYYQWGFLVQIAWAFIGNGGDVILIQETCSSYLTGLYSVISSIAKIGLFLVTSISTVMFPQIAAHRGDYLTQKKYLLKTCIYGSTLMIVYLVIFNLLKTHIVGLLYGEKYLPGTVFVFPISIFMLCIAIGGVIYQFFLASGRLKVFSILNLILVFMMVGTAYLLKSNISLCLWGWNVELLLVGIICIVFIQKGENE